MSGKKSTVSLVTTEKAGTSLLLPRCSRSSDAEVASTLVRYLSGNCGDVDENDRQKNECSLQIGFRVLSVYHSNKRAPFWIITEADRSSTTVLLPAEY